MYKECNHHHELNKDQTFINLGSGRFVADRKRIALLKALNDCGLITRTHCYGHEGGVSFVSILIKNGLRVEVRETTERDSTREIEPGCELLLTWDRID